MTNHLKGVVEGEIEVCLSCPKNLYGQHPAWDLAHPIWKKGDRVLLPSHGLEQVAVYGLGRKATVDRMMPGDEYVVIVLDDARSDPWGARMVRAADIERLT